MKGSSWILWFLVFVIIATLIGGLIYFIIIYLKGSDNKPPPTRPTPPPTPPPTPSPISINSGSTIKIHKDGSYIQNIGNQQNCPGRGFYTESKATSTAPPIGNSSIIWTLSKVTGSSGIKLRSGDSITLKGVGQSSNLYLSVNNNPNTCLAPGSPGDVMYLNSSVNGDIVFKINKVNESGTVVFDDIFIGDLITLDGVNQGNICFLTLNVIYFVLSCLGTNKPTIFTIE